MNSRHEMRDLGLTIDHVILSGLASIARSYAAAHPTATSPELNAIGTILQLEARCQPQVARGALVFFFLKDPPK